MYKLMWSGTARDRTNTKGALYILKTPEDSWRVRRQLATSGKAEEKAAKHKATNRRRKKIWRRVIGNKQEETRY